MKCFCLIHIILIRGFVAITAQGVIESFTFYQSLDFVIVHNEVSFVMEGSEGITMFMGILSPYGFCIHVPPLWLDKRNGHYGFGTMDITTFKLQLLVIDRRLKTVETSKTCFKGDFGLMRHFLGPIYTD